MVQRFHEKVAYPPSNLANAAVYVFAPEAARFIATLPGPFIDLSTEVIPHFLGRVLAVESNGYHRDVGNLEPASRKRGVWAGAMRITKLTKLHRWHGPEGSPSLEPRLLLQKGRNPLTG